MAPFETLYVRKYRSPIQGNEVGERTITGTELIEQIMEKIKLIQERLKVAQDRSKGWGRGILALGGTQKDWFANLTDWVLPPTLA